MGSSGCEFDTALLGGCVDYRISSLESDVCRLRGDLTRLSDRVRDLERERERKMRRRETALQALLMFAGIMELISLGAVIASHSQ